MINNDKYGMFFQCTTETQTDELYMNHLQVLQQKETTFEKMKHLLEGT